MKTRSPILALFIIASLFFCWNGVQGALPVDSPALVQAIAARSGDVYLRVKDRGTGVGGVYKFTRDVRTFQPLSSKLFDLGASQGLAVDKFGRVTVMKDRGTGGPRSLSEMGVSAGAVLSIDKATGSTQVMTIQIGQARSPGTLNNASPPTGFATPDPSKWYVPAPHTLWRNSDRTNVHNDHGFAGRVQNGSNTRYADMLTALADSSSNSGWYVSNIDGVNRHGGHGPNIARPISATFEQNLFQINNWISGGDFNTFPEPGFDGTANRLNNFGNPITSGLSTRYSLQFWSSCGDKCLASAGGATVADELTVPAKIVFSAEGLSAATQRVYGLQSIAGKPVVLRFTKDAAGNWSSTGIDSGDVVTDHLFDGGGTVNTFGIASKQEQPTDPVSDYIYRTNLSNNHFTVSGKFFRDGAIVFGYDGNDVINWQDRVEASGSTVEGQVFGLGPNIAAITSDGRGNVYYFVEEKFPPSEKMTEAFDSLDPNNLSKVGPDSPGVIDWEDSIVELPGGHVRQVETKTTTVSDTTTNEIEVSARVNNTPAGYGLSVNNAYAFAAQENIISGPTVVHSVTDTFEATYTTTVTERIEEVGTVSSIELPDPSDPGKFDPVASILVPAGVDTLQVGGKDARITYQIQRRTVVTSSTVEDITYKGALQRKVFYRQNQQFSLKAVNILASGPANSVDARTESVDRGGLVLDAQVWTRLASSGVGSSTLSFDSSIPPALDIAFVGGTATYDLDAEAVKLNDPPPTNELNALIDIVQEKDDATYEEDSLPFFRMENYPLFNGISAGPYGQMNTSYSPAGSGGSWDAGDGDGRNGFFGSNMYRDKMQWRWIVKAVSQPLASHYHDGVRYEKPDSSRNGIVFKGDWRLPSAGANYDNAADSAVDRQKVTVSFNDPTHNPPEQFKFGDPGEYEIELSVRGEYWDTTGLTFANSSEDVKIGHYGPAGGSASAGDTAPYIPVDRYSERFRIVPGVPLSDKYVWDVQVYGPETITEDQAPAAGDNWYAEAYVRFYQGIYYEYLQDKDRPISDEDMTKYHGVGAFLYPDVDSSTFVGEDWLTVKDGTSYLRESEGGPYGTSIDAIRKKDWEQITYEWLMKVADPDDPTKALPEDTYGTVLRSGNLAELWDLQRDTNGNFISGRETVGKNLTSDSTNGYLFQQITPSGAFPPRSYRVRIPLMTKTFDRKGFAVPTDPTAIQLTCRIHYPKVRWIERTTDQGKVYYDLQDDGAGFGVYRNGFLARGTTSSEPYFVMADPASDDSDDYVETVVQDATDPWVSGSPMNAVFDPSTGSTEMAEYATAPAGKALSLDALNTTTIYIVDNNAYGHLLAWDGSAKDPMIPRAVGFHYEVGEDLRVRHPVNGGVGLTDRDKAFGFDITHDGTRFRLSSVDFEGIVRDGSPNDLPLDSNYVYRPSRIQTWTVGSDTYGHGVHFSNIYATQPPPAFGGPAFSTAASYSQIPGNPASDWWDNPRERETFRVTAWELKDNELPMPIFLDDVPSASFKMAAQGEDREGRRSTAPPIASFTVEDRSPPNVLVEIVDFRSSTPVYFVANTDYARDFTSAGVDNDTDWVTLKVSPDTREVYGVYPAERRDGQYTGARLTDPTTNADFTDPGTLGDGAAAGTSFNYRIEEDVRFRVTVKAADNASKADNLFLSIEGGGGNTQSPFPELRSDTSPISTLGGPAVLVGTHFYPRRGEDDILSVLVRDEGGNERRLRIHVDVVPHTPDYRVIGDTRRRVR